MARIFPRTYKAENDLIISNEMNKQVYNHIETLNGGLDRESLPNEVLQKATLSDSTAVTVIDTQVNNAINSWKSAVVSSVLTYQAEDLTKAYFPALTMTMECNQGILAGAVSLHCNLFPYMAGAAKDMSRYRVAVFIDGIVVAETDNITEAAHSFSLPFATSVATKTVTIEARLKIMQGLVAATDAFKIYAGQLWARNGKA